MRNRDTYESDPRPIAMLIETILAETAKFGGMRTWRIYGDWTTPQMSDREESLHSYAV